MPYKEPYITRKEPYISQGDMMVSILIALVIIYTFYIFFGSSSVHLTVFDLRARFEVRLVWVWGVGCRVQGVGCRV